MFIILKQIIINCGFKSDLRISIVEKHIEYVKHFLSNNGFKGTVVNQELQSLRGVIPLIHVTYNFIVHYFYVYLKVTPEIFSN